MADYVTTTQIAAFSQEFAALQDTDAQDLLPTAASRLFDNLCEVPENFFQKYTAADPEVWTDRDFYGDGTAYLKLDPYVALKDTTPIVVEDTDTPDYTVINGQLVVLAKAGLVSGMDSTRYTGWPYGVKVTVAAHWGFTVIPADVQLAVIALAISQWRTADPANAVISSAEGAFTKVNSIADVHQNTIDQYRQQYSRRALFA